MENVFMLFGAIILCIGPTLILLTILDIIRAPFIDKETNVLLSKYYSSEAELLKIAERCSEIASCYYNKIFLPNPIYEKIYIAEVIQAVFINSLALYPLKYDYEISTALKDGIILLIQKVLQDFIPTIQSKYIKDCYTFRIKQYSKFFANSMNKLFLTQNDIAEHQHKLFFMTLSNMKILYDKDIEYFEQSEKAIPLVNDKVFNATPYKAINVIKEKRIFLEMIYMLYKECHLLVAQFDKLITDEPKLRKNIGKII